MVRLNFLLLVTVSSLIYTSALAVINLNPGKIATPSRFYLPKPPCSVIPLSYSISSDKNTRPVYEVIDGNDEYPRPIHQRVPIRHIDDINLEKFTRNPRVQLGESDWRIRKINKNYPLAVSPLLSQYGSGYPAINSANVNVDTPRVYSYITVNNIHNNRPFGQYKWTHGFDSDPSGNDSR
ncbi:hypothetical protein G9C98_008488 [Cotesia typhae]|uniref:Uncharacterized protein n=1 Tax=Cotesia typhae TaxID=2053667 RepID=A0A8J5UNI0_9HYME|nr:hypothetical protein G9C98_008488 [Cotesia typhae]